MRMASTNGKLYPLIWCELPLSNPVQKRGYMTANMKLFLATTSRKEWLNDERQLETYEAVLNPLYEILETVIIQSNTFQIIDRQITRNDLPNFYTAEIGNTEEKQVEAYWDVIALDFQAHVFSNKCDSKRLIIK
jgi:hypothetical protein